MAATPHARSLALTVAGTLMVLLPVAACSNNRSEPGATATSGARAAGLVVRTNSQFVTVENQSRVALRDIRVTITPVAGTVRFASTVPRIEPGEARNVQLDTFRSADGTALNRMFIRPREVAVRATDLDGNVYETVEPWRR